MDSKTDNRTDTPDLFEDSGEDAADEGLVTRIHRVVTALLQALMVAEFGLLVIEAQWQNAALVLVIFGIVLVPALLKHRFSFDIPA